PQSREEHEIGWPEPAVGSRHHLCHNRDWLCVLGCDPRCLVPSGRRLRHQPLDRCTARCCCAQGRHQRPQSAKGLRASFRPWVAVCLRRLSRRLAKARSHRLHGPARQSLRQRQGRELHQDTQGRSRVSDGIRNLRGRYSRPSPLHRRGLQHPKTPLRARLSEPRAIRGSTRPATCQNRRLKLSTIKRALQPRGGSKPGERRGGGKPGTPNKPKGERAVIALERAESEVRVLVLAGDKITSLGKDRLAELDQWAYGMAQKFAPTEKEGKLVWENDGDELRFMRFMAFSAKCALGAPNSKARAMPRSPWPTKARRRRISTSRTLAALDDVHEFSLSRTAVAACPHPRRASR